MTPVAHMCGILHRYGRATVLEDIDLSIPSGIFGLLGPNGAGKTTLLSILATLLRPSEGVVEILGKEVHTLKEARRARQHIGFLPQDFSYISSYSALDTVRYTAWIHGVGRRSEKERSKECLELVGLNDRADRKMHTLSGGMRQRVALACALVASPKLLLLDEPTVGLDPAQRLQFRDILRSLDDVAIVLSTHLVEDISVVADTVLVMSEGRVLFSGDIERMKTRIVEGAHGDTPLEKAYMSIVSSGRVPT